jgi:hypothetical protein
MDIYNRKYTPEQGAERIAKDHLAEDPNYYSKLQEMESSMYSPKVFIDSQDRDYMKFKEQMDLKALEREIIMARGGMTHGMAQGGLSVFH